MIDSHAHIDQIERPATDVVAEAEAAGVRRILAIGMDGASCRATLALAEDFPQVWAAIGRHPNAATGFDDNDAAELAALAAHPRCVAIGETGLDHYRDRTPHEDQLRAFHAQIDLASETGKPLIIHTRAADEETIGLLRERAAGVKVVLHCFSMPERLDECLAEGWFISFAGNVTYPKATGLREAASRVPPGRLLVETDAPYLAPQPVRGRPNEPANVVHTAQAVAQQRGEEYADLERTVQDAARGLFGW